MYIFGMFWGRVQQIAYEQLVHQSAIGALFARTRFAELPPKTCIGS